MSNFIDTKDIFDIQNDILKLTKAIGLVMEEKLNRICILISILIITISISIVVSIINLFI